MRVAVIGCGYWGQNLVRNLRDLGRLELVCDMSAGGRARARELAPGTLVTADLRVALDRADAVVIATPAATHFAIARAALEAGKDVFVEKPLALSYGDGAALVSLAAKRARVLMVGHVLEYHPAVRCLVDLVRSGELGDLQYAYSNRLSLGKVRREENSLWSFAPHDIAVLLRLIGDLPMQVVATGGAYVQKTIADVTLTQLQFRDGVRAHIYVSWLHPFKEQRLVIIGSRKMATFDDVAKSLELHDKRVEVHDGEPVPVQGPGHRLAFDGTEPLRLELAAFIEAVRERRPPLTDGESGLRVLQVLEAAQESLGAHGEPVTLRPRLRPLASTG